MKNIFKKLFSILFFNLAIAGCNVVNSSFGYFTNRYSDIDEPQTDDERTLVGEYNDYLLIVDSLANAWDGTDTLMIRRLCFNQRRQRNIISWMENRQNIRHSMFEKVWNNVNKIRDEIGQKFSPVQFEEFCSFHNFFDLKHNYYDLDISKFVDGNIYKNSYGEQYLLIKAPFYDIVDGQLQKKEIVMKRPVVEKDIESYIHDYKKYWQHVKSER